MRFIVFNGPPYSGKSTLAAKLYYILRDRGHAMYQDSFAAPMKHFVSTALGEKYSEMPKDAPKDVLRGRSVREFLIHMSEEYLKEQYGDDIFGRLLYHRALRFHPTPKFVIVDDSGFAGELTGLNGDHYLVQVHRHNTSFKGDSRSYLPDPHYIFCNDVTLDQLYGPLRGLADTIEEL